MRYPAVLLIGGVIIFLLLIRGYVGFVSTFDDLGSSQDVKFDAIASSASLCHHNPFLISLAADDDKLRTTFNALVNETAWDREQITLNPQTNHNHNRFRVFHKGIDCNYTCVGGACGDDTSKVVCGLDALLQREEVVVSRPSSSPSCVVYSIGGNNQWEFERDMLEKTNCDIHTFDCTGNKSRFIVPPSDRLFFHYECLGTSSETNFFTFEQLTTKYGHEQVDLLKMDIEGYEYGVFEDIFSSADLMSAPMQILVEVHYRTSMRGIPGARAANGKIIDWKNETDLFNLNLSFLKNGYIIANRDDNIFCPSCSELTLIRILC